jgi:4-alpha-glucanotransferase
MTPHLRLALVVHNHQPIGNFDHVVERAYHDSYRFLLDALAPHKNLRLTLHWSGSLFDWLAERHPEYLAEVAHLRDQGRVELLGGGYYEPILSMIPRRDRVGQIRSYAERLEERFGEKPRGMWLAERVWEQQHAGDLAAAGVEYTIVDDFHFRNAGLGPDRLFGYYLTEDDGRMLAMFPGSERLRYLIPYAEPEQVIAYLYEVACKRPGAALVFADDGEKFGTWPGMREHCHEHRWLERFFELLADQPWIESTTPGRLTREVEPLGKVYLPDGSYREMAEWSSLETGEGSSVADGAHAPHLGATPASPALLRTVPGTWRNFLVKYPEASEMRARMLMVSDRVARAAAAGYPAAVVEAARRELYKAQCNCAYWHGSFGGVYLAHLRQAVYRHLIQADDLLDRTADRPACWVEAVTRDHNIDAFQEVCLASDKLLAFVAPHQGGRLYELDVRRPARNLLATIAARSEPYHGAAEEVGPAECGVRLRTAAADTRARRCLVEHFYAERPSLDDVASGRAADIGDFADGRYQFQVLRTDETAQVCLSRTGSVDGLPIKVTKTVTVAAGADGLTIDYRLENLPADRGLYFGVEFNFAGFDEADGCYLQQLDRRRLGGFGSALAFPALHDLELVDEKSGVNVGLAVSRPASFWTHPVRAVNRRECGYEVTHQATSVVPHWHVRGDVRGEWSVTIALPIRVAACGAVGLPDLGDVPPDVEIPSARVVTHTEVVRGPSEVRRKTTRRLKAAG